MSIRKRLSRWFGLKLATLVNAAEKELELRQRPRFANEPRGLKIESPSRIINAAHITMGDNVSLGPGCMINAIRRYPGRFLTELPENTEVREYVPSIVVGDRVSATGHLSVSAVQSVTIGDDVIFAANVFVSDHAHGRERPDVPYKYQPLTDISPVHIGKGCWIGQSAIIMPGVTVGDFAIVGANSVVNRDVPPRSIVAGAPAKIVKTWSDEESAWVSGRRS
jgi:acetyltransferase-like isoleucine patch superfamily enzyme